MATKTGKKWHTRDGLDRVTVDVGRLRLDSSDLTLGFCTLLELCHLLPLDRRCGDLLTKNDITDFASCQRGNVDTVPLAEVLNNK